MHFAKTDSSQQIHLRNGKSIQGTKYKRPDKNRSRAIYPNTIELLLKNYLNYIYEHNAHLFDLILISERTFMIKLLFCMALTLCSYQLPAQKTKTQPTIKAATQKTVDQAAENAKIIITLNAQLKAEQQKAAKAQQALKERLNKNNSEKEAFALLISSCVILTKITHIF